MSVVTPSGLTERATIKNIVMQGEVLGPIECSVTVDKFGKECLAEQKLLYSYKGLVGVPPLAMVDDLACVSVCGVDTVKMNGYINAKTNVKKLQFGHEKCHRMHIGRKTCYCPDLFIDNWKVEPISDFIANPEGIGDIFEGEVKIDNSDEEKYLGDLITADGSNTKNIKARKAKGFGIVDSIISMLDTVFFGPFFFETAIILRSSFLINSILLNSEVWYGVTKAETEELEVVDQALLKRILEAPSTTPTPMLYLELGCLPIRYIIISRRIMYLHYLLTQDEDALLSRFFKAQIENPVAGDWIEQIKIDMEEIKLNLTMDAIKMLSKEVLQKQLKVAVQKAAFKYLIGEKEKRNKVKHVDHTHLRLQPYLCPGILEIQEAKLLFQLRTRMIDVRENFKNK